jgi:hypothetical protein
LGLECCSTARMEMVDNVVAYTTVADLISLYRSVSGCRYSRRQYYAQRLTMWENGRCGRCPTPCVGLVCRR